MGLASCRASTPAGDGEDASTSTTASQISREEALTGAHEASFAAVIEQVPAALAALDPVHAARAGLAPLAGPTRPKALKMTTLPEIERLLREARDIDADRLDTERAQLLIGIRFALERAAKGLKNRPARYDPAAPLRIPMEVLDALEHDQLMNDLPASAGAALRACAMHIYGTSRALNRFSRASLDGTLETIDAFDARLAALTRSVEAVPPATKEAREGFEAGATALRNELTKLRGLLARARDGAESLPTASWPSLSDTRASPSPHQLPPRIATSVFRRHLSTTEHVDDESHRILARLRGNLGRLRAMDARLEPPPESPATPLDAKRCATAQEAFAATGETPPARSISCEAWRALLGDTPITDEAVMLHLLEHQVVIPDQTASLRTHPPYLRMIAGRMAPNVHRAVSVIAGAHARDLPGVQRRAIADASTQLCHAAAAVLVHSAPLQRAPRPSERRSEVPKHDAATSEAWLAESCPSQTPSAWIQHAERHPWSDIEGGGMFLLDEHPYVMAALDRFWWMPLGLIVPFAVPDASRREPPTPSRAPAPSQDGWGLKVEDL